MFKAEQAKFEGINVLQVPGSRFIAVPHNGKYSCRRYGIIDLSDRSDFYHPDILRKEVAEFLHCLMVMEQEEATEIEEEITEVEQIQEAQLSLF